MDVEPADAHDLRRFVEAQASVYAQARDELAAGRKRSHWMWFVFPQLRGLGQSAMAHRYGIVSRTEAEAYLAHPVLGSRLVECTGLMLAAEPGATALAVLGSPDNLKFHSSMTLFAAVTIAASESAAVLPAASPFAAALDRFFDGTADPATLRLLGNG